MTTPHVRLAAALLALLSFCLAGCAPPEDPARLWKAVHAQPAPVQSVAASASAPAY